MNAPLASPTLGSRMLRVLLVEDSSLDALIASEMLLQAAEEAGQKIEIIRADRMLEALGALQEHDVDAAILDLSLPDARGPDSIVKLSQTNPGLPVVILSAQIADVEFLSALEYGAQEFLVKGEVSGVMILQAVYNAIFRKSLRGQKG